MTCFVVTGTGTGIGKSIFSAALTGALQAHYWKPIQSGLEEETDSELVARLSGITAAQIIPEAYRLQLPASPHLSAEVESVAIDVDALAVPPHDPLVIEGAGGVLVPLTRSVLSADLFAHWQVPVILVATTQLGTISHSLSAIESLRVRSVPIHGIAFVGDAHADNEAIIPALSGVRRLGRLPIINSLTADSLAHAFAAHFDVADFK